MNGWYSMAQERRQHQRYPFNAIALVRNKSEGAEEPVPTLTENISLNGIEFHSYIDIEEGTAVSVELKFTNTEGAPVTDIVHGRIIWRSYRGNFSAMGCSFDRALSPDKNPVLYDYFKTLSRTDKS